MITVRTADALNLIAARVFPGADVSRFTEILDQNPELDVFSDLAAGTELNLPSTEQIQKYAQPVLGKIASSLGGARGYLGQAEQVINQVSGKLPPELQGYAKEALNLVGEANGVLDQAEGILDQGTEALRDYGGQATNLIQWLLSGKA
jgi:hypothetical protein